MSDRRRSTIAICLGVVAVVLAAVALVVSVTRDPEPAVIAAAPTTTTLQVPNVLRLPEAEAVRVLRDAGFKPKVTKRFHDNIPAGRLMQLGPMSGPRGATIELVISRGPYSTTAP